MSKALKEYSKLLLERECLKLCTQNDKVIKRLKDVNERIEILTSPNMCTWKTEK